MDILWCMVGVSSTWTLRCEHYHLLNEVWSNENRFGKMILVRSLKDRNTSGAMNKWEESYKCASNILSDNSKKRQNRCNIWMTYLLSYILYTYHRGKYHVTIFNSCRDKLFSISAIFLKGGLMGNNTTTKWDNEQKLNNETIRNRDEEKLCVTVFNFKSS